MPSTTIPPSVGRKTPLPPLHTTLPPLILGTATFNHQYVGDPSQMPYRSIVSRAIELGVTAFDTSPYYGPSESLLGAALTAVTNPTPTATDPEPLAVPRDSLRIITKAGRIAGEEFDYSPAYIRYSVMRSLRRLNTPYLDLVYTHDVEFVSPAEVLAAVRELRRLRDEDGLLRYVGISGFPVPVLCDLAELIYRETGEPLDAVMSYGHFTVQNRTLGVPEVDGQMGSPTSPLERLKAAGVDVVLNASMLGMGLLTSRGIPPDAEADSRENGADASPLASWHPSPPPLRIVCKGLGERAAAAGERLEPVAIRWSMEEFARIGAEAGTGVGEGAARIGGSVMGVTTVGELEETVSEWRGAVSSLGSYADPAVNAGIYGAARSRKIHDLVHGTFWPYLGDWKDFSWASPGVGYVNSRREEEKGVAPSHDGVMATYDEAKARAKQLRYKVDGTKQAEISLTPLSSDVV